MKTLIIFISITLPISLLAQPSKEVLMDTYKQLSIKEMYDVLEYTKQQEQAMIAEFERVLETLPPARQKNVLEYMQKKISVTAEVETEDNAEIETTGVQIEKEMLTEDSIVQQDSVKMPSFDLDKYAHIEWTETYFDFGDVTEGDTVSHNFIVKNIGRIPLEFSEAKSSCGCTAPAFSKEPIEVGEEGFVTIQFDSTNKEGVINQAVVVYNNTPNLRSILYIKGNVVPRKGVPKED